jgi:hypothetical protein
MCVHMTLAGWSSGSAADRSSPSVNNPPHIYAASPPAGTTPIAAVSVLDSGVWVRQLPQLAEPLAPLDLKAQLTV